MTELYNVTAVRNVSSPTMALCFGSNSIRVEAASVGTPRSKYQYFCNKSDHSTLQALPQMCLH